MTAAPTPALLLQSSTTHPPQTLLPRITRALQAAGSYIRSRRTLSSSTVALSFETHRHATEDTYAALIASGLDLDRAAHMALATLCAIGRMRLCPGSSPLHIDLEIRSRDQAHPLAVMPTLAASA